MENLNSLKNPNLDLLVKTPILDKILNDYHNANTTVKNKYKEILKYLLNNKDTSFCITFKIKNHKNYKDIIRNIEQMPKNTPNDTVNVEEIYIKYENNRLKLDYKNIKLKNMMNKSSLTQRYQTTKFHVFKPNERLLEFNDNLITEGSRVYIVSNDIAYIDPQLKINFLSSNSLNELEKFYKGYINVRGDGSCYYRSVIYSLLTSILFSNYNIQTKERYINRLLDIFKEYYDVKEKFFNEIKKNLDITYLDFLILFTRNDKIIRTTLRKLLIEYIKDENSIIDTILGNTYSTILSTNYLEQRFPKMENINNLRKYIEDDSTYIEGSMANLGLLPKILHSKGQYLINQDRDRNLQITISKFKDIEDPLPMINVILIREHYGILIPKEDLYNKNIQSYVSKSVRIISSKNKKNNLKELINNSLSNEKYKYSILSRIFEYKISNSNKQNTFNLYSEFIMKNLDKIINYEVNQILLSEKECNKDGIKNNSYKNGKIDTIKKYPEEIRDKIFARLLERIKIERIIPIKVDLRKIIDLYNNKLEIIESLQFPEEKKQRIINQYRK